jgi:hypothetical protein
VHRSTLQYKKTSGKRYTKFKIFNCVLWKDIINHEIPPKQRSLAFLINTTPTIVFKNVGMPHHHWHLLHLSLFWSLKPRAKERLLGNVNSDGGMPTFSDTTVVVVLIENVRLLCLGEPHGYVSLHKTQLHILDFVHLFLLVFLYYRFDLCIYSIPNNS